MRRAFSHPGFGRLYAGLTTSAFGDSVMLLVLSIWVKTLTGSNAKAGLTFFFMMIPALVAPVLGAGVDRVRRKPLLVWGNLASALVVLPLLAVRSAADVWVIWTVAFLYGISFVVIPAGVNGLLKELLPDEHLVDANSALQTTKEAFRLIGPLIGAAVFAVVGGGAVALIDAASFVVAAVVIAAIDLGEERPARDDTHLWHQTTAGLRHLAEDRVLRHVLVGFGVMLLVVGFTEASIYALLDGFGKPATFAGVIVTVQGVGAVAGGLTSNLVIRRVGEVAGTVIGMAVMAAGVLVVAATTSLGVVLASVVVVGASIPLLFVAVTTLVQRRTPKPIMGRVSMAVEVIMGAPQALSLAVGALLVSVLSYRVIFALIGAFTAAGAVYVASLLSGEIREEWGGDTTHAPPAGPGVLTEP
jgi:MFS family permease